jgi:hypothetical protein
VLFSVPYCPVSRAAQVLRFMIRGCAWFHSLRALGWTVRTRLLLHPARRLFHHHRVASPRGALRFVWRGRPRGLRAPVPPLRRRYPRPVPTTPRAARGDPFPRLRGFASAPAGLLCRARYITVRRGFRSARPSGKYSLRCARGRASQCHPRPQAPLAPGYGPL